MKFFRRNKYILSLVILILGVVLQLILVYRSEKESAMAEVDSKLLRAAGNIKYYLEDGYVNRDLNGQTYSKREAVDIFTRLQERAEEQGVDYLYILVRDGDDIVYAALSDYEEEIIGEENALFWYSLREAADDSFDETWRAFESKTPIFLDSTDEWDSYRSVYIPETAPDGTRYIAGADVTMKTLNGKIMERVSGIMKMLLITFPLIVSFISLGREKKFIEDEVRELSTRDTLTGVLNRDGGLELFEILSRKRSREHIFLVDICGLKKINADMGLAAGDRAIKIFVKLLARSIRKEDVIIRIEGDKFLVILKNYSKESERGIASNLERNLEYFNHNNRKNIYLQATHIFKGYRGERGSKFIEEMLKELAAKKRYTSEKELKLIQEIFESIEGEDFVVYYQPKVNLERKRISYEALIRWEHPRRGMIPPGDFIGVAEKSIAINRLTIFVLREALKAAEEMRSNISINISPVAFESNEFIEEIKKVLNSSPYSNLITFEVTEGIGIRDIKETLRKMKCLAECGIRFSIDDFGTGYSSLGYLEKLPVKEVKIDKTFTDNLKVKTINPLIVKFICELGQILEFDVIVEGVEREEQVYDLIELGGTSFQGYFFDKPQSLEVIKERQELYMEKIREVEENIRLKRKYRLYEELLKSSR